MTNLNDNCELSLKELDTVSGGEVSLGDAAIIIGGLMLVDTAVQNGIEAMKANGQCKK
ncbi:MAG TPA: hypothetical protein VGM09_16440 [Bradyrhizobium sp.]|jgi:hypothetical protein